jgi:hypothetical protein
MSVHNYIWFVSLDGSDYTVHIEETSLEDARKNLIQKIEQPDTIVRATIFGETYLCPIIQKDLLLREYIMTSFPTIQPV